MSVAPEATRTEHSRAGVASFVLSGILFLVILFFTDFINFLTDEACSLGPRALDAPGFFLEVVLLVLLVLLLNLAALEFGIAGAVQQRRKRSFAVFGTAISVLTFVVAYIQDVLW